MTPVVARISLLATVDGGRKRPLWARGYDGSIGVGRTYGCPLFFEAAAGLLPDVGYDSRLFVREPAGRWIAPGASSEEVLLLFVFEDRVVPYLEAGLGFRLWEGHTIGRGAIVRLEEGV